jgi:3-oxoacyl-[acyl-carrier-protein] synthase II
MDPTRGDVAVTGLGLVTPGGVGVEASWRAVCGGRSTAALDDTLAGNPVRLSCRVPGFDAEALLGARRAYRLDPFVHFALVAAREALADAGLDPRTWDGARVGVVLGSGDGGARTWEQQHDVLRERGAEKVSPLLLPMQLPNMLAGQTAIEFGARGPNLVVTTACASGTTAIGTARDLLAAGRCDVVLAGGSEAMITPLLMAGFAQMGALSRREDGDGFVAGEGAGILVLERLADARARRARVRARLVGYGASADAHHMTQPDPRGTGIEAAMRAALTDADAAPADVGHINAHGTSTPWNDRVEAAALSRVMPGGPLTTSTKGVTGHLLGAAGAVEAVFCVLTVEQSLVPPTANLHNLDPEVDVKVADVLTETPVELALSNSCGFGGQNASLVIAAA